MTDLSQKIAERAAKAIAEKIFPGGVVGIAWNDGTREILPFGTLRYEGGDDVREDTMYDLASVTKSIPVASLALTLIAEGKLAPSDLARTYVPTLRNDHDATIEDLLTYRVRGQRLSLLKEKTAEEMLQNILEAGFEGPRGEAHYTNLPALILGFVIERAGGDTIDNLARKYFFDPFDMPSTTFFPFRDLSDQKERIAPSENEDWRGEVCGFPHDESAYIFAKSDRACGHAGLFSTAPDLLNFLERVLQGELPAIAEGAQKGWGWELMNRPHTFGKTGFTGTSVVVDVERGVAFAILSSRTYPKRPPDAALASSAINRFRANIADILLR